MTDFSQFFIILFALANKNVGGDKLLLSPYIEQGELDKARELSRVRELSPHGVESYSGLLTVEKDCNSHLFFWFFPAAVME
jgi:vitellogenic carboxypeptidase-like protein